MPEGLEAEIWRRACEPLVARTIVDGWVDDRVAPPGLIDEIVGATIAGVRRVGKVVLLDLAPASTPTPTPRSKSRLRRELVGAAQPFPDANGEVEGVGGGGGGGRRTVGLHFGMTGRLVIDGAAPIRQLVYASGRDETAWDRLVLHTASATANEGASSALRLNDPRRLGKISLDADLSALGVDLFAVTPLSFDEVIRGRRRAIKPLLLDQGAVAGLGNLLADEMLWWAGLSPHRSADTLSAPEVERFVSTLRRRLPVMLELGGSTTGTLSPDVRAACPPCSRDGAPLRRETIGGRTAVWCPQHQR